MPKTKEQKQLEAAERMAEHNKLTTLQKLEKAMQRGGAKEIKRLQKLIKQELDATPAPNKAGKGWMSTLSQEQQPRKNV